tara:strand:- start:108 stop:305 length:198 start_codon:yes stop_codon:yes gene_type:complete
MKNFKIWFKYFILAFVSTFVLNALTEALMIANENTFPSWFKYVPSVLVTYAIYYYTFIKTQVKKS